MPNWCDNRLYIAGDTETIKTFIEKVTVPDDQQEKRGQRYDILGNLYPTPQELKDTVSGWSADEAVQSERNKQYEANKAKYGSKDWYDWNIKNWGTKWGDCDTYIVDEEPFITPDGRGHIEFVFQSAWSPALEGIAHITKMFPSLEFACSYAEEGMGFYGFCTFIEGEPIDNCEQVEDIPGYNDIDFEDEDSWMLVAELVQDARDQLLTEAGW